jgi:hypothetical protein
MKTTRILDILKPSKISIRIADLYYPHVKLPLGRWNIHHYRETALKIKHGNEDNCGLSSHIYKNIKQIDQTNKVDGDNKYIYMMGFESVHK